MPPIFSNIELTLTLLVVATTVAGVWLAVLHSLPAFGFATAYIATR